MKDFSQEALWLLNTCGGSASTEKEVDLLSMVAREYPNLDESDHNRIINLVHQFEGESNFDPPQEDDEEDEENDEEDEEYWDLEDEEDDDNFEDGWGEEQEELFRDPDLGGTGHGDISHSDADPGL